MGLVGVGGQRCDTPPYIDNCGQTHPPSLTLVTTPTRAIAIISAWCLTLLVMAFLSWKPTSLDERHAFMLDISSNKQDGSRCMFLPNIVQSSFFTSLGWGLKCNLEFTFSWQQALNLRWHTMWRSMSKFLSQKGNSMSSKRAPPPRKQAPLTVICCHAPPRIKSFPSH